LEEKEEGALDQEFYSKKC